MDGIESYAWVTASRVMVTSVLANTMLGEHVVDGGNAVILASPAEDGTALVIEGTPAELHALARRILLASIDTAAL